MNNVKYQQLHELPKVLNNSCINTAATNTQVSLEGHGKFDESKKFTVIQNRKGHRRNNNLSYVLTSNL